MQSRALPASGPLLSVCLTALVLSAVAPVSRASDIHDLQRGLPLDVEDTTTADNGSVQLQGSARYEHQDGDDLLFLEPQAQVGLLDNLHVEFTYPIISGSGDRTGAGDISFAALYRFYDEQGAGFLDHPLPSMAVKADVELPTGVGSDGLDTTLRFIATKTMTQADSQDRVHLNLSWTHNAAAAADERENFFSLILGYSRKLDDKTVVLADLIREQQEQERQDSTILEAGVLRQLADKVTLGAGLGFGLGADSPDFRATFGIQYSF
jgi:hypothetical protein